MRFLAPLLFASLLAGPTPLRADLPVVAVTDVGYLGGGIADTFHGRVDGQKFALKPTERIGESRDLFGDFGQGNPEGELVCLPIMRRLDLEAPVAKLFKPGPGAAGVLATSWVDDDLVGGTVRQAGIFLSSDEVAQADAAAFARMLVADVLIGNPDRHGGNFFVWTDSQGVVRPIPIDHNLALIAGEEDLNSKWMSVTAGEFHGLVRRSGRLAQDAGWGDRVLQASRLVAERLTPAVLEALVEALPPMISAPRKAFLRKFLVERRAKLAEAAEAWRRDWSPATSEPPPELPGRLGWVLRWNPQGAAGGACFAARVVESEPELAEPMRRFLEIPDHLPLPDGLPAWARSVGHKLAAHGNFDLEPLAKANEDWADRILATIGAARSRLGQSRGMSPEEVDGFLLAPLLEFAWRGGQGGLETLLECVRGAAGALEGRRLGRWTLLRVTAEMAQALWPKDFRERLGRFRELLTIQRTGLQHQADAARMRASAKLALHSEFGRLLAQALPASTSTQREGALWKVLGRFGKAGLVVQDRLPPPRSFGLALRLTAEAAGTLLEWQEYCDLLVPSLRAAPGAWLIGWEGPVSGDDVALGVSGYQFTGLSADAAAGLTFDRYAFGAFGSWRGLRARLADEEVRERVYVPGGGLPGPPVLKRGKGRVGFTAPDGTVKLEREDRWLHVSVKIPGLIERPILSIPVVPGPDGTWLVGDLEASGVDLDQVEALGFKAGDMVAGP